MIARSIVTWARFDVFITTTTLHLRDYDTNTVDSHRQML